MRLNLCTIVLLAVTGCAGDSLSPAPDESAPSAAEPTDAPDEQAELTPGEQPEPAPAAKPEPAPERVFEAMDQALADKDEAAFKARWHPQGYEANLVGGSGIPGSVVFKQGARKGWYLKPDFSQVTKLGDAAQIVPCDIWSREKQRAVDHVHALVVRHEERWVIVGAGEKREQVDALANRFVKGEQLAPPEETPR